MEQNGSERILLYERLLVYLKVMLCQIMSVSDIESAAVN